MNIKNKLKNTKLYILIYKPIRNWWIKKQIQRNPKKYISKRYKEVMNREVNFEQPVTYTEKVQWRKVFDDNPLYEVCADKVAVRDYVQEKISGADKKLEREIRFPVWYGVWDSVDKIEFETLPNEFVLKSNHASGHVIICTDKTLMNWEKTKMEMKKWLKTNFYYVDAEKHYKNIKPQIICEELLEKEIVDYRIFCFNGSPYFIKVTIHNNDVAGGYDDSTYYCDWNKVDIVWNKKYGKRDFEQPKKLEQMIQVARILSSDFDFVRVDLYSQGDLIYFSELTFTPNSGFERDLSYEWDKKLGELWKMEY